MSDQNSNYSLITGKVVACFGKVDGSTLSLQATFFLEKWVADLRSKKF